MMYKIKTLLLICSLLPLFISCDNEPENHELTPNVYSLVAYADQRIDSIGFYTNDSWSVTPQVDWITYDGTYKIKPRNYKLDPDSIKVIVFLKPNTTGQTRTGRVLVNSYDYSYSSPIIQLGLLNVLHPTYTVDNWLDERSGIPEKAHYELVDSAHWTRDSICFTVHDNWDLEIMDETNPDWLSLDKTTDLQGTYRVNLTLTENTDSENERKATLRLTSGEVSNTITVRQLPNKKGQ